MLPIVTIDGPLKEALKRKTAQIQEDEFALALEIVQKLMESLKPYLPAAGLAAPQIGISKAVFIYSFDRDPKNLEAVINPRFKPVGQERREGWEACFSVILSKDTWKIAKVPRFQTIEVEYLNREGKRVQKVLHGFAATVFQHECDHLEGIENIERKDAEIKSFSSREELSKFMAEVKKKDSLG
jgi:peptide deformylase